MEIVDIFEHPTIERLAQHLSRERGGGRDEHREQVRSRGQRQRDAMSRRRPGK
jgi:hypothetical protein